MKNSLLFFLLIITSPIFSQNSYFYDLSGNRQSRTLTLSKSRFADEDRVLKKDSTTVRPIEDGISERHFSIFPNPTEEEVHIQFAEIFNGEIFLYDMQGRIIEIRKKKSTYYKFDLSRRGRGSYIICICEGNQRVTWKIIKK